VKSSFLTRDQALSLWSGSIDCKTLDYQRTNPREYQIVRTTQMKPLEYNTRHHPTNSSTLCRTPHLNKKQNKNTNPISSRQDYHLTQPCPWEEGKQTNSIELQKPNVDAEVYNNNKKCDWIYTYTYTPISKIQLFVQL